MALTVNLNGTGTGFKSMLDTARTQVKSFSNSVTHEVGESWGGIGKTLASSFAGIFAVEGIKRTLEWFVDTGKEIKETAEQVDMSTESWQKWSEAVDKAGLSTTSFQRIVEMLREKRTTALTDPKARSELSRLGFSDADITGEMDMGEFTRRALENANGGDLQRKYLSDVIGQRGLKYATAIPNLASAKAPFSDEDLKEAADAADKLKELGKTIDKIKIKAVEFAFDPDAIGKAIGMLDPSNFLDWIGGRKPRTAFRGHGAGGSWDDIPAKADVDPMESVLAQQKIELAQHEQDRQQRLLDSKLGLMTIGDRRATIVTAAEKLRREIAERETAVRGNIFLTQAEQNSLSGVTGNAREYEINKLRAKYQDRTTELQIELNKYQGDLREKPLTFKADTMQGVGLYQASALAFNPVLGVLQEQTQLLRQIVRNTDHSGGGNHPLEP